MRANPSQFLIICVLQSVLSMFYSLNPNVISLLTKNLSEATLINQSIKKYKCVYLFSALNSAL